MIPIEANFNKISRAQNSISYNQFIMRLIKDQFDAVTCDRLKPLNNKILHAVADLKMSKIHSNSFYSYGTLERFRKKRRIEGEMLDDINLKDLKEK
ncbi:hypothetical protein BpHYR1_018345 [Brachionus plicatilis]|uniref:Uncharacterized protein n=1 Tax=Brachionus plicatilis TaxID=10195 RepID=A0A3M7R9S1_BRAPC|nr:hypothetical protein BpHYR1_018345 [Brachionus plicatilis]